MEGEFATIPKLQQSARDRLEYQKHLLTTTIKQRQASVAHISLLIMITQSETIFVTV